MNQLSQGEFDISQIELNANGFKNSRTIMGDLSEMKASIIKNGLINPPIVYRTSDDDGNTRYVLLAGYRRFQAINEHRNALTDEFGDTNGWFDTIQCSIFEGDFDEALALNISENLQREDLNFADKAEAIDRLVNRVGNQSDVAKMLGISQPNVSQMCSVYNGLCKDALEALRHGNITLSVAKKLSKILSADGTPNVLRQSEILDEIFNKDADVPEEEQRKRAKTFRSKKEFEELRTILATNEELSVDSGHRSSLNQFLDWAMCLLETEDMLFRVDTYINESDSEFDEVADEEVAPKRRIRVGE